MAVLRRRFLPNMHSECCIILQGTLGCKFDIFAASGEFTAWVLLWKTRSRPIGVRVCPVAQFNFFNTAFDPRAWTMVVFWKETLGRQPQIITPENDVRDGTNYPSPPNSSIFLMIPMFLMDPVDLQDLLNRLAHHQDGLQLHHLLVIQKEWNLEELTRRSTSETSTTRTSTCSDSCE